MKTLGLKSKLEQFCKGSSRSIEELKGIFDDFEGTITRDESFRFERESPSHGNVRNDCGKALKQFAMEGKKIVESLYAIARFIRCYVNEAIPKPFRLPEKNQQELKDCSLCPIARLDDTQYCSSEDFASVAHFRDDKSAYTDIKSWLDHSTAVDVSRKYATSKNPEAKAIAKICVNFVRFVCYFEVAYTQSFVRLAPVLKNIAWSEDAVVPLLSTLNVVWKSKIGLQLRLKAEEFKAIIEAMKSPVPIDVALKHGAILSKSSVQEFCFTSLLDIYFRQLSTLSWSNVIYLLAYVVAHRHYDERDRHRHVENGLSHLLNKTTFENLLSVVESLDKQIVFVSNSKVSFSVMEEVVEKVVAKTLVEVKAVDLQNEIKKPTKNQSKFTCLAAFNACLLKPNRLRFDFRVEETWLHTITDAVTQRFGRKREDEIALKALVYIVKELWNSGLNQKNRLLFACSVLRLYVASVPERRFEAINVGIFQLLLRTDLGFSECFESLEEVPFQRLKLSEVGKDSTSILCSVSENEGNKQVGCQTVVFKVWDKYCALVADCCPSRIQPRTVTEICNLATPLDRSLRSKMACALIGTLFNRLRNWNLSCSYWDVPHVSIFVAKLKGMYDPFKNECKQYFEAYEKTTLEVHNFVKHVKGQLVTIENVNEYKRNEEPLKKLVYAAGHKDAEDVFGQLRSFDFEGLKVKLRTRRDLLGWLRKQTRASSSDSEIPNVESHISERTSYKMLINLSERLEREVAHLDRHSFCIHEKSFTAREFVTYFLFRSKFFEGYVNMEQGGRKHCSDSPRIVSLLETVHNRFVDLLQAKETARRLMDLYREMRKQQLKFEVQDELEILANFEPYRDISQTNVRDTIDLALDIVRHVDILPDVMETLQSHEAVADEDDMYDQLIGLTQQQKEILDMTLNEVVESKFEMVKTRIGTVPTQYWEVMKNTASLSSLIDFFKQYEHDFDDRKTFVSDRLRSDSPDQSLLNNVIVAHRYFSPLLKKQSMSCILEEVKTCTRPAEAAKEIIETVHSCVDKVKLLFKRATTESARQMARDITGIHIHLNRMVGRNTTVNLVAKKEPMVSVQVREQEESGNDGESNEPIIYSEEQVQDLRRILVFDSKETKDPIVQGFLATLKVADRVVKKIKDLEAAGHPFYQKKQVIAKFNDHDLEHNETTCEQDFRVWKNAIIAMRRSHRLFHMLSKTQIMSILILFTKEISCKPMLLEKLSGKSGDEEEADSLDTKSAKLIAGFIRPTGFKFMSGDYVDNIVKAMVPLKNNEYQVPLDALNVCLTKLVRLPASGCYHQQLYYCMPRKSLNSFEVINFLLQVFLSNSIFQLNSDIPFAFSSYRQICWLSQDMTSAEVGECIERMKEFPEKKFVFVGVDKLLPSEIDLFEKVQREQASGACAVSACYLYFDSMDIANCEDGQLRLIPDVNLQDLKSHWEKSTNGTAGPRVEAVCGLPLSGKTNFVYRHLKLPRDCTHICINDSLDEEQVIQQLNSSDHLQDILITLSSVAPFDDVNKMLFNLLLCRSLCSDKGGLCFSWPQGYDKRLVIEVSCQTFVSYDKPWDSVADALKSQLSVAVVTSSNIYVVVDEAYEASVPKDAEDPSRFVVHVDGLSLNVEINRFSHIADTKINLEKFRDFVRMDSEDRTRYSGSYDDNNVVDWIVQLNAANVRTAKNSAAAKSRYIQQCFTKLEWLPESVKNNEKIRLDLFDHIFRECDYLCKPRLDCSQLKEYTSFVVPSFKEDDVCLIGDVRPGRVLAKIAKISTFLEEDRKVNTETNVIASMLGLDIQKVTELLEKWNFILTADVAFKMVLLHHRLKAGIPVIIEGETGVGKTFLLEMYTELMNARLAPALSSKVSQWIKEDVIALIDAETEFSIDDASRKDFEEKLQLLQHEDGSVISLFEKLLKKHCDDSLKTQIRDKLKSQIEH